MTTALAAKLFEQWNDALQSGDPQAVADCYAEKAVLVPTFSSHVRTDHAGIVDYFTHFLRQHPVGRITDSHVQATGALLVNSGRYTFTCRSSENDTPHEVHARFTFIYRQTGERWEIVTHHSSKLPE